MKLKHVQTIYEMRRISKIKFKHMKVMNNNERGRMGGGNTVNHLIEFTV